MQFDQAPRRAGSRRWHARLAPLVLAATLPMVIAPSSPAGAAVPEPRFAPFKAYPAPGARSAAIADFTGDGRPDVVVNTATSNPDRVEKPYVYAQTPAGELEQRAVVALTSQANWYHETSVAASDLDGDGRADAVVAGDSGLDVLLQRDGALATPVLIVLAGARQVEIADIDGDGLADLVVNGDGGVA